MKIAAGKVLKGGSYPLKQKKLKYQSTTEYNTHRLSLEIEGVGWLAFGDTDKENFYVETDDGWKILGVGSVINVAYKENGDYKNAVKSKMTVLELVEGKEYKAKDQQSTTSASAESSSKPYDDTGVKTGHAIKCAAILVRRHKTPFMEGCEKGLTATDTLQQEILAEGKVNKYTAGMQAGCAVLSACEIVTKAGSLLDVARKIVVEYTPQIELLINPVVEEEPEEEEQEEGLEGELGGEFPTEGEVGDWDEGDSDDPPF